MRSLIVILSIGTLLLGCGKQKEQLEKFVFDNSQIAYRDTHKYTFDKKGRIKADLTTSYQYMAGVPFDSTVYETIFEYNDKGQLVSAINLSDSSRELKIYNDLDSLVGDYRINEFGDTISLQVTVYNQNKVVRRIHRTLSIRFPEDLDNIKKGDFRNYDTLLFVTDLIYDKDIHVKSLFRDKMGTVTEEIDEYYEGNRHVKAIAYAFLGDAKYIKETTYYESTPDNQPDFVSIGTQGDTTAFIKTVRKSDGRMVLNYNKEFDMQDISYYDNRGQLLATVVVDVIAQEKTVTKYTYDNKGNKIEEITYREKLINL
jgi:YD repeat-containing protein